MALTKAKGSTWDSSDNIGFINVKDKGALGDGSNDDTAAIQAAVDDIINSGTSGAVFFPRGIYRVTDEINIYRASSTNIELLLFGEDQYSSVINADFTGREKVVFKAIDGAQTSRVAPTSFKQLKVKCATRANTNPCLIDVAGMDDSRISQIRLEDCDNTAMRLGSANDAIIDGISSNNSGHHFVYKSTTGITFSTSGTTLTSSASIFDSGDVGKVFTLLPADTTRRAKYTITAFTNATTVTVSPTTVTETNEPGEFQPARVSITTGTTTLTAESPCFTVNDVGQVVYIKKARAGSFGDSLLRATIATFNSATSVELDRNATNTITDEEFAVPVLDFYTPDGAAALTANANDVVVKNADVDNYAGIGIAAVENLFFRIIQSEVKGADSPTDDVSSLAQVWFDNYGGSYSGVFDGLALGASRFYSSNFDDMLTVDWLASRRIGNEIIFLSEAFTDPGGYVAVRALNSYGSDTGLVQEITSDGNSPFRIVYTGIVNFLTDSANARTYIGGTQTYAEPSGKLVIGNADASDEAEWLVTSSGNTALSINGNRRFQVGASGGITVDNSANDHDVNLLVTSVGNALFLVDSNQRLELNNGGGISITGATPASGGGELTLGTSNAATVGAAGGAAAPPATPDGYLIIVLNGTVQKIPYYAN